MYLVSVGTTKFDGLIRAADQLPLPGGIFQIADGSYTPRNHDYVRFTGELKDLIVRAEFIISHAGAGVLFESLQRGKKVICVPNMERSDRHQIEIAEELSRKGMVLLVTAPSGLKAAVEKLRNFTPAPFTIPKFEVRKFCSLTGIRDNQVIAILASGGGHLEEARILADSLISFNRSLSVDFYIPQGKTIKTKIPCRTRTAHFHPYSAKYRGIRGWIRFAFSAARTLFHSLTVKIPRQPDHVISVGTADTAILFARIGWLGASRTVLESRARVRSISHSSKVLRLFKSSVFKQWDSSTLDAPAIGVLYDGQDR